jgi:hypothetical protein
MPFRPVRYSPSVESGVEAIVRLAGAAGAAEVATAAGVAGGVVSITAEVGTAVAAAAADGVAEAEQAAVIRAMPTTRPASDIKRELRRITFLLFAWSIGPGLEGPSREGLIG